MTGETQSYPRVVTWLLSLPDPWVVYNTLVDIVGADLLGSEVQSAYQTLQNHPLITTLLDSLITWPQLQPLKRAYDSKDSLWKLQTLADFGLNRSDGRIQVGAEDPFRAIGRVYAPEPEIRINLVDVNTAEPFKLIGSAIALIVRAG